MKKQTTLDGVRPGICSSEPSSRDGLRGSGQPADLTSSLQVQCHSRYIFDKENPALTRSDPWPFSHCAVWVNHWTAPSSRAREELMTAGCWDLQTDSTWLHRYILHSFTKERKHNLHPLWNYYYSTFESAVEQIRIWRVSLLNEILALRETK